MFQEHQWYLMTDVERIDAIYHGSLEPNDLSPSFFLLERRMRIAFTSRNSLVWSPSNIIRDSPYLAGVVKIQASGLDVHVEKKGPIYELQYVAIGQRMTLHKLLSPSINKSVRSGRKDQSRIHHILCIFQSACSLTCSLFPSASEIYFAVLFEKRCHR